LDGASDNINVEKERWKRANAMRRRSLWARLSLVRLSNAPDLYNFLKIIYCKMFFFRKFVYSDKMIDICKECDYDKSPYFTDLAITHYEMREYNPKSLLEGKSLHQFEDTKFYILNGYDGWLKHIYGDYMKMPPEEQQIRTHDYNKYYWRNK
jgi:lipopolysaccharide cholinephosphotransferase